MTTVMWGGVLKSPSEAKNDGPSYAGSWKLLVFFLKKRAIIVCLFLRAGKSGYRSQQGNPNKDVEPSWKSSFMFTPKQGHMSMPYVADRTSQVNFNEFYECLIFDSRFAEL